MSQPTLSHVRPRKGIGSAPLSIPDSDFTPVPISSSVTPTTVPPRAFVFPNTDANDQAQVLSGNRLHIQDGAVKESAPALPKMSALELADLSRMAHRKFSSDLDAYRFWRELVVTAAFHQMLKGRS